MSGNAVHSPIVTAPMLSCASSAYQTLAPPPTIAMLRTRKVAKAVLSMSRRTGMTRSGYSAGSRDGKQDAYAAVAGWKKGMGSGLQCRQGFGFRGRLDGRRILEGVRHRPERPC